jgi:hypothetical protein
MDRMTSISTLVKIAETGGFAAAARKLGVSPSTVSTQFQDLEDRLGVRLLDRTTRKVSLTESSYRHIEALANGVAEGEPQAGAHVDIKRTPELAPEEVARKSHYKFDQAEPIVKVEGLAACDAIIIGAGTRSGRLRRRWSISSTRRADFGRAERCRAKSAAPLRRRPHIKVGRRQRCSLSSPISCISAW